jgi:hypothetical protein
MAYAIGDFLTQCLRSFCHAMHFAALVNEPVAKGEHCFDRQFQNLGSSSLICLFFTHLWQSQCPRQIAELLRNYPQANALFSGVTLAQPAAVQLDVSITFGTANGVQDYFTQVVHIPQLH